MKRYEFRTLQERLLSYMVVLVLLPVLLLVGIGLNYAEHQIERQIMKDLSVTMSSQMQKLHLAVTNPVEDLRIIVRSPYVQQALSDFSAVYDATNLYSMEYQDEQDKYWIYLSFYAEKHGLSDLLLINPAGDVVFSAAQSDQYGRNLDHVDFTGSGLQRAFRQSLWQMDSAIAVARNRNEGYVYIASPVVVEGSLRGVVMLVPGTGLLKHLVDASSGGERDALTIYRRGPDRFQALLSDAVVERQSSEGKLIATAMLGKDYEGVLAGDNNEWLVSVRALPVLDSVVIMRRDRETVLAAVSELRYSGWGVTLVILLLTVVISRRVAKNLSAPVYELSSSIEKISHGERDVRVNVERKDELGTLARHFNEMAASLRATQAQLVQSEKMASIGHLAAGVAHEINNPMSVVSANMSSMQEYTGVYVGLADLFDRYMALDKSDEDAVTAISKELTDFSEREDIQYIHQDMKALIEDSRLGLDRVRNIVSSLKVFSELDRSDEVEADLKQTLETVIAELNQGSRRPLEVEYRVNVEGKVLLKESQMRIALAAIADNASRACSEKGSLLIRAARDAENLYIDFQDTGCGMEDAEIKQIFNPFYTTREVGDGIGLGLSVAHSIVEAHGGSIRVKSRPGRGTLVRIVLPGR